MATRLSPDRLDVRQLAQADETLSGEGALSVFARLAGDSADLGEHLGERAVRWTARAEWRRAAPANSVEAQQQPVLWLHITASAELTLTCQRCLAPMSQALEADRWFRFVADEATALLEDEDSEEDVLVFQTALNLLELIEDELIMAQPLVPKHEVCPTALPTSAGPVVEDAPARPNPFAVLQQMKKT